MTDKTEIETVALIEHYGQKFAALGARSAASAFGPFGVPQKQALVADADRLRELVGALPEKTE